MGLRWDFCLNFPDSAFAREPGSSRLPTHQRFPHSGRPSPCARPAALMGSRGPALAGRALGKGRLALAPEHLASPRPCRVPHLGCWGVLSGGLGAGVKGPRFLGWAWPALPKTQGRDWLRNHPRCAGGSELPGQPRPCPSRSPHHVGWPGPLPSLVSPRCSPPCHSSHIISQAYRAFPTSGPWPVLFPFPRMPAPPLFPGHLPVYHSGLSRAVPSSETFLTSSTAGTLSFDTPAPCWFSSPH